MLKLLATEPKFTMVLCPSIEVIRNRASGRNKTGYTHFNVTSLYEAFMAGTPPIGLWLDSGNLAPEETADLLLEEASL